jgi:hypothetical protein
MALTNYKANVKKDDDQPVPFKPCSQCNQITKQEDLIKFGTMCEPCFNSYCRQAPAYMHELDKYRGDSRAWAKRIIDKHESGTHVNQIALKMAKEALQCHG